MKLTVNKSGEIVKAIIMELNPAEALIVNHAMRRYTEDEGVSQRNREEMDKMFFVEPIFLEVPNMSENPTGSNCTACEDTETWNGIHAHITAPKGIFKKIWGEAESEDTE